MELWNLNFNGLIVRIGLQTLYLARVKDRSSYYMEDLESEKLLQLVRNTEFGRYNSPLAEFVAEYTKRPLLTITPGDIGTNPREVEAAVAKFFDLENAGEQFCSWMRPMCF